MKLKYILPSALVAAMGMSSCVNDLDVTPIDPSTVMIVVVHIGDHVAENDDALSPHRRKDFRKPSVHDSLRQIRHHGVN